MDLFGRPRPRKGTRHWDPCCFCGRPIEVSAAEPVRVWLELPSASRTRLLREYCCHEACFQQALAPSHRTGSGRPIERSPDGVILNAAELTASDLSGERVLCPGCGEKTFARWPEGWDAHAAHRCAGADGTTPQARKSFYRKRFGGLFIRAVPPRG